MAEALIAGLCISLLSMAGAFVFGAHKDPKTMHRFIIPVAIGVFLGVVFFELIPETLEASSEWGPAVILLGFLGFYFLSHVFLTFHHHHADNHDTCGTHGGRALLIGDGVHNFADGIVIASAFMIHPSIGILTTVGIALHEIPQEIAEFGVLMHSGYTRKRALFLNFLSSITVVVGIGATYLLSSSLQGALFVLTGIAAGNLLYIAAADLIPELRHSHRDHFMKTFLITLFCALAIGFLIHATHNSLVPQEIETTLS